jgi:hypothetical protein
MTQNNLNKITFYFQNLQDVLDPKSIRPFSHHFGDGPVCYLPLESFTETDHIISKNI